jgi:hypothetical protein
MIDRTELISDLLKYFLNLGRCTTSKNSVNIFRVLIKASALLHNTPVPNIKAKLKITFVTIIITSLLVYRGVKDSLTTLCQLRHRRNN